jgi:hypothetical protein
LLFPYDTIEATGKEVMRMGAKERILSIRLLEKLKEKPAYAETLGVEAAQKMCEKESERANL